MTIQKLTSILNMPICVAADLIYGLKYAAWYRDKHPVTCEQLDTE